MKKFYLFIFLFFANLNVLYGFALPAAWNNSLHLFAGKLGGIGYLEGSITKSKFGQVKGMVSDSNGNIFISDSTYHVIRKLTPSGNVSIFAGTLGVCGSSDGTATSAQFCTPGDIAIDSSGNLYLIDESNCTIRKITSSAVVTTLAGTPGSCSNSQDGTGSSALFYYPTAIAVDSNNNLYVGQISNIRKITPLGVVTSPLGEPGIYETVDGNGIHGHFANIIDIAIDSQNNILVLDQGTIIRKINANLDVITLNDSNYTNPYVDGNLANATFNMTTMTIDSLDNIYIADKYDCVIRKISNTQQVTTILGNQNNCTQVVDGNGLNAQLNSPNIIAIDPNKNLYIFDDDFGVLRKANPNLDVSTISLPTKAPNDFIDGLGPIARFLSVGGMTKDNLGNLFLLDPNQSVLRKITKSGLVTTFSGNGSYGNVDGDYQTSQYSNLTAITSDSLNNIFVGEENNPAIRKIDASGTSSTIFNSEYSGDAEGGSIGAQFQMPSGVAIDSSGNIFVADTNNNVIRKISSTGVVTTIAGSAGVAGMTNATGTNAFFNGPLAIAIDSTGANLYIADSNNNQIRKLVVATGVVTLLAGSSTGLAGSTNGTGTAATFDSPRQIVIDSTNANLYVTDANCSIRKIVVSSKAVSTYAGSLTVCGYADATGTAALFNYPSGLTIDSTNNLYVSDSQNYLIRKISTTKVVTTLAGTLGVQGNVDGTGTSAQFNSLTSLTIDGSNNLYVIDTSTTDGSSYIRKITSTGVVSTFFQNNQFIDKLGGAASYTSPNSIKYNTNGNIYLTNVDSVIKINLTTMDAKTVAGYLGIFGYRDGTGSQGQLGVIKNMALNSSGDIYFTETSNHKIKKLTVSTNQITFFAGGTLPGFINDTGIKAKFNNPSGLVFDSSNNLYVADTDNQVIRKVTPAGVVTTFAGVAGNRGYIDGIGTSAKFSSPTALTIDSTNNLYVADIGNNLIRKISPTGIVKTILGHSKKRSVKLGHNPEINTPKSLVIANGRLYINYNDEKAVTWITLPK